MAKEKILTVRLPAKEYEYLKANAKREYLTVSQIIRKLIREFTGVNDGK